MVEDAMNDQFVDNPEKLRGLLSDAEKPLYGGCLQFTKLSSLVQLGVFNQTKPLIFSKIKPNHSLIGLLIFQTKPKQTN